MKFSLTAIGIAKSGLCLLGLVAAAAVQAQDGGDYEIPRTIDGQPDLQGVWANNTMTPVERPEMFGEREYLTDEEMAFLRQRMREIADQDGDALFGSGTFNAAFSGEVTSYDPSTGNYDQSWLVEREVHNRTSQIVDPPNGRYPPRTEESIALARERAERVRNNDIASWLDMSVDDRCINYGAPYLNTGYNSYWQIVQSQDHVVIVQEMIHDARIIPLTEKPLLDDSIRLWHGDPRGYWDGDTLVVETGNFSEKSHDGPNTAAKRNIERFTRIGDTQLLYQFTSDDPGTFAAPYTLELLLEYSPDPIYEYACHEGNYAMENILRGARELERLAAEEP